MNTSSLIYLVYCPDMDGYIVLANRGKYSVTRPFMWYKYKYVVPGLDVTPDPRQGWSGSFGRLVVWSFGRLVVWSLDFLDFSRPCCFALATRWWHSTFYVMDILNVSR
jgi:hypothetical protein